MPSKTSGAYVCPDCGRSFSLERGLTRHRNYAHQGNSVTPAPEPQPAPEPEPAAPEPAAEEEPILDDDLRRLAKPLQQEVAGIQAQLDQLNTRRDQLMGRLRSLQNAVRALEGTGVYGKPGPKANGGKPKQKTSSRHASPELVEQVWGYIEAHAEELEEGFTAAELGRRILSNGSPKVSKDRVRVTVLQLHQEGRLRLDRMTQGGGRLYKLIGAGRPEA